MGASAYAPENTLKSIRKALEMDVNTIEVDVQASKDGHLIVFHDLTLRRIAKMDIFVKDLTLNELKKINVGENERIPTLDEVFQCILGKDVGLIIELKVPNITKKVYEVIKKYEYVENVIVDSFFHREVYKIKNLHKKLKTGIDLSCMPIDAVSLAQKARADYILMNYENLLFYTNFPEYSHKNEIGVIAWTVNEIILLRKIIKMGVDGVITDDPEIFERL